MSLGYTLCLLFNRRALTSLLIRQLELTRVGEDLLNAFLANAIHHRVKHPRALVLIFDKRITLTHSTKTDTFLQVIHLVEVFTPQAINSCNHHSSFQRTHRFFTELLDGQRVVVELLFCFLVLGFNVAQDLAHQVIAGQRAVAAILLLNFLRSNRGRVVTAQGVPQFLEVPFTRRQTVGLFSDDPRHQGLHEALHLGAQILAFQDATALLVDQLTLVSHHIVILQDVLSNLKVTSLNLVLCGGNRTGDDTIF